MVIILFALMYFLMIRPQKKRQRKHADTLKKLQKGDHVVTIGRLHGTIDSIDRDSGTVTLDCDGIYLIFDLKAIASVEDHSNKMIKNPLRKISLKK
ncbi:MAG: preprotein translocase subunit YajC [Acetilactobacillus jinshanensis]